MTPEQFKETHQSGDAALLANARDLDRDAEAWYEEGHHDKAMELRGRASKLREIVQGHKLGARIGPKNRKEYDEVRDRRETPNTFDGKAR